MTITQKIRRDLLTESSYTPNGTMITCSNQFMRRNFRLYIDGSYKGEAHYTENCQFIRENREHPLIDDALDLIADEIVDV